MKKVVITTTFGEFNRKPLGLLKEKGFEVIVNPYKRVLKKDEVIKLCKGSTGIIAGTEILDADTLESLAKAVTPQSSLMVISRCGAGLDNVDLDVTRKLGINVFNTPDAPTLAVAKLTIGLKD